MKLESWNSARSTGGTRIAQKKDCILCGNFDKFIAMLVFKKCHRKVRKKKSCEWKLFENFDHWQQWTLDPLTRTYLTSGSESFAMAQTHRYTNKYKNIADSRRNPPRGPIRWKQLPQRKFSLGWLHTWLSQGTQEMDQQWITLSNCILPGLGTVAPRGAHFFSGVHCKNTEG